MSTIERSNGHLQTLDRGLSALTVIANAPGGMLTIGDLADRLDIHRTIVYRIVATLEAHSLVARGARGTIRLGAGLVALSSHFEAKLRDLAQPVLDRLANVTGAAAFLSVPQGDQCVAIIVAEPQTTPFRVSYRIGTRHPLSLGAAGIAILAGRPEAAADGETVREARTAGYSLTHGQLQPGAIGIAWALRRPEDPATVLEASIGVITLGQADVSRLRDAVHEAVTQLRALLGITREG